MKVIYLTFRCVEMALMKYCCHFFTFHCVTKLSAIFKVLIPLTEEKHGIVLGDDYSIGYVQNNMNETEHDVVLHYRILHK